MKLALIQTRECNEAMQLKKLATALPRDMIDRAEIAAIEGLTADDLPHFAASLPDATEDDFATVRAALAATGVQAFEVTAGTFAQPPANAPGDPEAVLDDPEFFGCTPAEFRARAEKVNDAAADIKRIIEGKDSGIPFPELSYDGRTKKAYDSIVQQLGRVPMDDKGEVLRPGDIKCLKRPRGVTVAIWNEVVDHLEQEIRFFQFAREWFGNTGNPRAMFRDQVVLDYDFVHMINARYKLLRDTTVVKIFLDVAMGMATKMIGGIPPHGAVVAAAVSTIWAFSKGRMPDPNAKVSGKISEIRAKVAETFLASVHTVEQTDIKLSKDWGLLSDFGNLVMDGKLVWPKDMSSLRNAHAYAFQYESMRVLLSIVSGSTGPYNHFGIAEVQRYSKKPVKRSWHPEKGNYHLHTASREASDGHYYVDYFLGGVTCSMVPMAGLVCDPAYNANKELQKKLFGVNTKDDFNPDFGLPSSFLDNPKSAARKGWSLDQFRAMS